MYALPGATGAVFSPPPIVNSRFRLHGKVRRSGQIAIYEALDLKQDAAPVLLWTVPAHGPLALRLAVTLDTLTEHDLSALLELRATGLVVSGGGADLVYLATERPEVSLLEAGVLTGEALHELARHLAEAIQALHEAQLGHGALHPGMVFRCGNRWKLGGVGMVARGPRALLSFGWRPPLAGFAAPETLTGQGVQKADAWGLGALVLFAGTGVPPFDGHLDQVLTDLTVGLPPRIGGMPQPLDLLVQGCLLRSPERRWTAQRALATLRGEPNLDPAPMQRSVVRPRSVRVWPATTARRLPLHTDRVSALAWHGETLLTGDAGGRVLLTGEDHAPLGSWQLDGRVTAVLFFPRQQWAAASAGGQLLLGRDSRILELESPLRALRWSGGLQGITSGGAWVNLHAQDGSFTACDGPPMLWGWSADGTVAATLDGNLLTPGQDPIAVENGAAVLVVQQTPGGPVVGTADGRVVYDQRSWDNRAGEAVIDLAVEPRRKTSVACAKADHTVHLLTLPNLEATHCLQAPATCLAFSPDGQWLAVGQLDGSVGLWPVP